MSPMLTQSQETGLLRFMTCGSVDDGKSTLIGRLLHDADQLKDDQLVTLAEESKRVGTQGGDIDYALLLDGLTAEREQGITIDVAWRYFTTPKRRFIVADTPGHEQYTRNMATAASVVDAAVVLVDARKGVLAQTRRHSYIASLLGVKHLLVAVNKMDMVGYAENVFHDIEAQYQSIRKHLSECSVEFLPVAALTGENVVAGSTNMPWYQGSSLLTRLEEINPRLASERNQALRFPVQLVVRPNQEFRGYAGTLVSGQIAVGEAIRILPSAVENAVARIVTADGDKTSAEAGDAVTLVLAKETDVTRGDLIVSGNDPAGVADQFDVTIIWMGEAPALPGRGYQMKLGSRSANAQITAIKHKIDVNSFEHLSAPTLMLNDIGVCTIATDRPMPFDSYSDCRDTGGFLVIDRQTHQTVGAGLIHFALRRSDNIHLQALEIDKKARAIAKGQRPCVVWMTGLSGSGKSTIANLLEQKLHAQGRHTYLLDGDNLRHGLNRDLGFKPEDRVENIRRAAEVAKLMVDAGLIVIVALISPFRAERRMARELFAEGEFYEVYIETSLAVAESRDPKGLYRKARQGKLPNFTGIDSPYETPENPEVVINSEIVTAKLAVDMLIKKIDR
jgi:bifunctional enzyme CysN/CysC